VPSKFWKVINHCLLTLKDTVMSNILKLNDTISSGSLFEHATQQQMRQEDYSLSRDKTGY